MAVAAALLWALLVLAASALSEQLDENKGVIDPPPVGDAEIHAPAPEPLPGTTPVIPPPGTPGGDPSVVPKLRLEHRK